MQTVGDLKKMIKGWWGDEQGEQKLIIGTEVLADDGIVLGMYGISDKSIIHLEWRQSRRPCRLNKMIIKSSLVLLLCRYVVRDRQR